MTKSPAVEIIESMHFVGSVTDEIVASVSEAISEKGKCSLVLSGGSTPASIYRTLSKPPHVDEIDWSKVDLYWGDERWVPHDHVHSNFRMTNETLLSQLKKNKPQVHAVDTSLASPELSASAYELEIRKSQHLTEGELPSFDIVLLGVGEDGHTASLFPGCHAIKYSGSEICAAVSHPDGSARVTLTPRALYSANKVFYIVKGESKADIMPKVIEAAHEDFEKVPATLFKTAKGSVSFFLDSGAATKLSRQ